MQIGQLWDALVDCICRPPRDDSYTEEDLVGGRQGRFGLGQFRARRDDLVLVNKQGLKLQCSHFIPEGVQGNDGRLPCVIYCHCNSGSRRDAEEALYVLIPLGVTIFTLDFAGSGLSEGKHVTLGATEVEDVEVAVKYLRESNKVSTLGLWGRSMGAVTALLYSARDPSIAGVVVDSPFSRLTDLMLEIVEQQKLPIPKSLTKVALSLMKRSVRKRANFDINQVAPIDVVGQSFIPALFGHATEDTFILMHHSEALHAAYAGDKNLIKFEGDHNSRRPDFYYNSVSIFFHNTLQLDSMLVGGNRLNAEIMRVYGAAVESGSRAQHRGPHPPLHETGATTVPWQLPPLRERERDREREREKEREREPHLPVSTSASAEAGEGGVAAGPAQGTAPIARAGSAGGGPAAAAGQAGLLPLARGQEAAGPRQGGLAANEGAGGEGEGDYFEDAASEDADDDFALAEAIRQSLLEAQRQQLGSAGSASSGGGGGAAGPSAGAASAGAAASSGSQAVAEPSFARTSLAPGILPERVASPLGAGAGAAAGRGQGAAGGQGVAAGAMTNQQLAAAYAYDEEAEEEMLRAALALSLQDQQGPGSSQQGPGQGHASTAARAGTAGSSAVTTPHAPAGGAGGIQTGTGGGGQGSAGGAAGANNYVDLLCSELGDALVQQPAKP